MLTIAQLKSVVPELYLFISSAKLTSGRTFLSTDIMQISVATFRK